MSHQESELYRTLNALADGEIMAIARRIVGLDLDILATEVRKKFKGLPFDKVFREAMIVKIEERANALTNARAVSAPRTTSPR